MQIQGGADHGPAAPFLFRGLLLPQPSFPLDQLPIYRLKPAI